ncbi:class II aldolase/adducin family protein [Limnochorda pilosa]|uniref:L-fuculose phosphate aldolase n=1 Tax=Limnochorda pilosa TaxID=1555112 RepID=A0A0K2SJR0_LIMPI|nr:class II aldolase/adducin family protein [Limnochorda pilosa]BAS27330.1 L-fuculose phosphate aldolase [Limnochorda pilosa]
MRDDQEPRRRLVALGRRLLEERLVSGTGGNLSMRTPSGVLITPSGVPYQEMAPGDLALLAPDGERLEGARRPSSETPMHLEVYRRRPDVGGVVHTHSRYASAFATAGREIPPFHYMVAAVGDRVPLAPYATFGTAELAASAVETLADRYGAVLLERHGVLAVGATPEEAFDRALAVEHVAEVSFLALQLGFPEPLPPEELERLRERFEGYGRTQHPES